MAEIHSAEIQAKNIPNFTSHFFIDLRLSFKFLPNFRNSSKKFSSFNFADFVGLCPGNFN